VQKDTGKFVRLYVLWKYSSSNCIIGTKDHASIQVNVAEADKMTGSLNGQKAGSHSLNIFAEPLGTVLSGCQGYSNGQKKSPWPH
uniref:Uncharacterized protein n=1 Tax=Ursus americanus TaxID=9643 RepID=A0A452QQI7_URSAM